MADRQLKQLVRCRSGKRRQRRYDNNLTSNAQSVTFTLDFSALYAAGVSNVSFQLFDIDYTVVPEPGALGACLVIIILAVGRSQFRPARLLSRRR